MWQIIWKMVTICPDTNACTMEMRSIVMYARNDLITWAISTNTVLCTHFQSCLRVMFIDARRRLHTRTVSRRTSFKCMMKWAMCIDANSARVHSPNHATWERTVNGTLDGDHLHARRARWSLLAKASYRVTFVPNTQPNGHMSATYVRNDFSLNMRFSAIEVRTHLPNRLRAMLTGARRSSEQEQVVYHKRIVHDQMTGAYRCEHCTRTFNSVNDRNAHTRRMHTNERPKYPCPDCTAMYKTRCSLQKHYRVKHIWFTLYIALLFVLNITTNNLKSARTHCFPRKEFSKKHFITLPDGVML
jgi:hypothetical protein